MHPTERLRVPPIVPFPVPLGKRNIFVCPEMVSLVPHINTLIVDIGTEMTKVGYAGDYHPFYSGKTPDGVVQGSLIKDTRRFVEIVKKQAESAKVDSVIILLHCAVQATTRQELSELLVKTRACGSFYFLDTAVCEVFGHGRTSGMVFSVSGGSSTIAAVTNGVVKDCYRIDNQHMIDALADLRLRLEQDLLPGADQCVINNKLSEIKEVAFGAEEPVDISDIIGKPAQASIHPGIAQYSDILDKLIDMRSTYKMVKSMINGSIICTGGYFRNMAFFQKCKNYLVEKHGANLQELVIHGDGALNACFTGASIFGNNIETKTLFKVVPDYQYI